MLTAAACNPSPAPETTDDLWSQLTIYQKTAIEMCNGGADRLRTYHRLAERATTRKLYIGLRGPLLAETIETYTRGNHSSTFREFIRQFATNEATFVWQHRQTSAAGLDQQHLLWCREQDDWISSYR